MLHVGFDNTVAIDRVIAILKPGSSPLRREIGWAKDNHKAIHVRRGDNLRSVIVLDTGHLVLSSVHPGELSARYIEAKKG